MKTIEERAKDFALDEYLKNPERKVVTRDGRKVRSICTDVRSSFPVITLVERFNDDIEDVEEYTKDGKYYDDEANVNDLFFAPEKHEGYACVHFNDGIYYLDDTLFSSKEEAYVESKKWGDFVATVKVEWGE